MKVVVDVTGHNLQVTTTVQSGAVDPTVAGGEEFMHQLTQAMTALPQLNSNAEVVLALIRDKMVDLNFIASEFNLFKQISDFDEFIPDEDIFSQFLYYLEARLTKYELQ